MPRDDDVEALKTIVVESPIPVIADIHFNHTLALKAIDAGAHCIRLNPGNIGGREKVAEVAAKATAAGVPMRIGVNSGSLPKHLHELEREAPVEALVAAAVEFVELMESLDFENFKVSIKSTNVPNTIAANRLLSEKIPYPLHLGITEAGTKWSGSLKSVGRARHPARRRDRRHDPDQPLDLPRRGGGQGRLGDPQGAAAARARPGADRLPDLRPPAVRHGLGRGRDRAAAGSATPSRSRWRCWAAPSTASARPRHADFGIAGAKNEGLIFAHGKPLRKVPQAKLVDALFEEIDKSLDRGRVEVDEAESREGAAWLAKIEEENAGELTPGEDRADGAGSGREGGVGQGAPRRGGFADGRAPVHAGLAVTGGSCRGGPPPVLDGCGVLVGTPATAPPARDRFPA